MYNVLINVFIIMGIILSVLGGLFVGMFGVMVAYDLLHSTYNDFKLKLLKRDFKNEKKLYIMSQLEDLKERYPDLEIDYKIK